MEIYLKFVYWREYSKRWIQSWISDKKIYLDEIRKIVDEFSNKAINLELLIKFRSANAFKVNSTKLRGFIISIFGFNLPQYVNSLFSGSYNRLIYNGKL